MSDPRLTTKATSDGEIDPGEAFPLRRIASPDGELESGSAAAPEEMATPSSPGGRARLATILAISIGGLLGANTRFMIGVWAADRWGSLFPWGTLLINVSGSFVLGFYLTLVTERFTGRSTTRLFVATGFLGAYTTFSTFSFEIVELIQRGDILPSLAYVAASLVAGLVAVVAGVAAAHAL